MNPDRSTWALEFPGWARVGAKKMMLTVSILMVSITFSASHATPKKQCISAQPNLCLVGMAGACPSNGIQMPWCMASKNVMIQMHHLHSLVALRLIRENPKDSSYTVLCFLHLQAIGPKKKDTWRSQLTNDTRVGTCEFGTKWSLS